MELSGTQQLQAKTDKQNSSYELIERKEVENTPFTATKEENTGWFLAIGRYKLTKEYESLEELLKEEKVKETNWNLLLTVIELINLHTEKNENEEKI